MLEAAHAVEPVAPAMAEPYAEIDCVHWLVELPVVEGEIDVAHWFLNDHMKED